MYNRYIPQADGTYRRSRVQDSQQRQRPHCPPPPPPAPPKEEHCDTPCRPEAPPCPPMRPEEPCQPKAPECRGVHSPGFLSQLLPKDFDTGDLIVVLLLLLLAGDCEEDRSTALLTLALYFIM